MNSTPWTHILTRDEAVKNLYHRQMSPPDQGKLQSYLFKVRFLQLRYSPIWITKDRNVIMMWYTLRKFYRQYLLWNQKVNQQWILNPGMSNGQTRFHILVIPSFFFHLKYIFLPFIQNIKYSYINLKEYLFFPCKCQILR